MLNAIQEFMVNETLDVYRKFTCPKAEADMLVEYYVLSHYNLQGELPYRLNCTEDVLSRATEAFDLTAERRVQNAFESDDKWNSFLDEVSAFGYTERTHPDRFVSDDDCSNAITQYGVPDDSIKNLRVASRENRQAVYDAYCDIYAVLGELYDKHGITRSEPMRKFIDENKTFKFVAYEFEENGRPGRSQINVPEACSSTDKDYDF